MPKADHNPTLIVNQLSTLQVVMAYTVALAVFIFAFWHSPDIAWVQWLAVAAVGAALYGPQVTK